MSASAGAVFMAAKEKDSLDEIQRYELKAKGSWFKEATKMASSLGLSLAAYIRLVVVEDIDRRKKQQQSK